MGLFQSKPKPLELPPKNETETEVDASKIIDELEDVTTIKSVDTIISTEKTEPTYTEEFKSTDETEATSTEEFKSTDETEPTSTEEFKSDDKSTVSYTYIEEFEPVVENSSVPIQVEDANPAKEAPTAEESRTAEESIATDESKKKKKSKRNKKQYKQDDDVEVLDLIS
jgi:hypothetical protein